MTATLAKRPLFHSKQAMDRLIAPRSVAIVGASPRPGSFGANVRENCRNYAGRLYLVSPSHQEIDGEPCYPNLSALPEVPDCVVVAVKRELVEPVIRECADLGVGGALVFASGYAEVHDADRKAQQDRLVAIARQSGLLIAGPNTVGSSNFANGAVLTFSPEMKIQPPVPRAIAVVSQSGAVGYAQAQAMHHDANLSHVLVCGNSADIDVADYVAYLAEDQACAAIVCLVEGMDDPRRLVEAARKAQAAGKILIMNKAARGDIAAAAAMSHTGSIAGSHKSYVAALEAAGAIFVEDHEHLIDTANFLVKAGRPKSEGVAVITASGGWGIILADHAEEAGVTLPPLPEHVRTVIEPIIPEFGSAANPCDVTAQILSNRKSLAAVAGAMLDEECYGLLVWPQVWSTHRDAGGYKQMIVDIGENARARGKIACMIWSTQWLECDAVASAERNDAIAVFRSPRACFDAIALWHRLEARRRDAQPGGPPQRQAGRDAANAARALLDKATGPVIGERDGKAVLRCYGIETVAERVASDPKDAATLAQEIGFPVAIKVDSPNLPHKSEAGGVKLDLRSPEQVIEAADEALSSVKRFAPDARIDGLLVQEMASAGVEMLVGTTRDPQFGPMVLVGFGGVLAEVADDARLHPAPVTPEQATGMLDKLRCRALLDGFRGMPAVDVDKLAEVIARISELAADFSDEIAEIDVNPLICRGSSIRAADALIVRQRK